MTCIEKDDGTVTWSLDEDRYPSCEAPPSCPDRPAPPGVARECSSGALLGSACEHACRDPGASLTGGARVVTCLVSRDGLATTAAEWDGPTPRCESEFLPG